jgi:hypothetical protein
MCKCTLDFKSHCLSLSLSSLPLTQHRSSAGRPVARRRSEDGRRSSVSASSEIRRGEQVRESCKAVTRGESAVASGSARAAATGGVGKTACAARQMGHAESAVAPLPVRAAATVGKARSASPVLVDFRIREARSRWVHGSGGSWRWVRICGVWQC